jgi:hypothetical protein
MVEGQKPKEQMLPELPYIMGSLLFSASGQTEGTTAQVLEQFPSI